jgi:hypothetical protein
MNKERSVIGQTPGRFRPAHAAAAAAPARLVHQSVDPERDQCEHEEEHDDDYRDHVVFLDHVCGREGSELSVLLDRLLRRRGWEGWRG